MTTRPLPATALGWSLAVSLAPDPSGAKDAVADLRVARSAHFGAGGGRGSLQGVEVACLDPVSPDHFASVGHTVRRADRSGLEYLLRRGVIDGAMAAAGADYAREVMRWRVGIGAPQLASSAWQRGKAGRTGHHKADDTAELLHHVQAKRRILKAIGALAIVDRVAIEEATLADIGAAVVAAVRAGEKRGVGDWLGEEGLSAEDVALAQMGEKARAACIKARLVRGLRALVQYGRG
jgi:hypothetical protein